jgi:hypothetical protein
VNGYSLCIWDRAMFPESGSILAIDREFEANGERANGKEPLTISVAPLSSLKWAYHGRLYQVRLERSCGCRRERRRARRRQVRQLARCSECSHKGIQQSRPIGHLSGNTSTLASRYCSMIRQHAFRRLYNRFLAIKKDCPPCSTLQGDRAGTHFNKPYST